MFSCLIFLSVQDVLTRVVCTVQGQLGTLTEERTYFVSMIINEKTSLLVLTPPNVLYIDTHLQGSHGAVIVKGTYPNLTDLREFID